LTPARRECHKNLSQRGSEPWATSCRNQWATISRKHWANSSESAPCGRTEICPVRALSRWLQAAEITEGPVFRRIWLASQINADALPPLPAIGQEALTTRSIGRIVQARAAAAGFGASEFGGHSLKRGALTTGMEQNGHPAQLKRLGRHKSFEMLREYREFGDLFENHTLSGVP